MEERRKPVVGEGVVYVDPVGKAFAAVVTAVWGPTCVNVVFVSKDESRTDTYGRQIERESSCSHATVNPAHGRYWHFTDEAAKETEH